MFKNTLVLAAVAVLTIGTATMAYAKGRYDSNSARFTNTRFQTAAYESDKTNNQKNMLDIMEQNGYGDIANEMRNGNYRAMSDFMNNLSDKDYQNMIDIMKNNGFEGMANMMQNIGKDGMVQMHNAMTGSGAFNGNQQGFGGMMGGNFQNQ